MNYDSIEKAITPLVENLDKDNYPIKTLALQQIIADLEYIKEDLKEE